MRRGLRGRANEGRVVKERVTRGNEVDERMKRKKR